MIGISQAAAWAFTAPRPAYDPSIWVDAWNCGLGGTRIRQHRHQLASYVPGVADALHWLHPTWAHATNVNAGFGMETGRAIPDQSLIWNTSSKSPLNTSSNDQLQHASRRSGTAASADQAARAYSS